MNERTPVATQPLGADDVTPTSWQAASRTYWLATMSPDGRPHVMPLLGLWLEGAFYSITGETTRKRKGLARNPRCLITASSQTLPALDVIIEGEAHRVTDRTTLQRVTDAYASALQWELTVRDGAVYGPNAPTAGPPPYAVFELMPTTVFGLPGIAGTTEGRGEAGAFSPTRWRF